MKITAVDDAQIPIYLGVCLLQSTLMSDPGLVNLTAKLRILLAVAFLLLGSFLFGVVITQGVEDDVRGGEGSPLLCIP